MARSMDLVTIAEKSTFLSVENDAGMRYLLLALAIHDLNKCRHMVSDQMAKKKICRCRLSTEIQAEFERLEEDHDFFQEWREYVRDIVLLAIFIWSRPRDDSYFRSAHI